MTLGNLTSRAGSPPLAFIPNQGQWTAPHQFQASLGNATVFFMEGEVRLTLYEAADLHNLLHVEAEKSAGSLHLHALKIDFPGSKMAKPQAAGQKSIAPFSYFLGDKSAVTYPTNELLYPQLYAGIDMLWKAWQGQLKYDFIVTPGANPAEIRIRYQGGEAIRLLDGRLQVSTSVGQWYEEAPYAYQLQAGKKVEVPCRFRLQNGIVDFEFPQGYDRTQALVIDPTLVFSTYSGAGSDNFGYTAAPDIDGNMYTAGIIYGPLFPTTVGAYQDTFTGLLTDIGILKFDPTGSTLLYATFFGGNTLEYPHSIIVNENSELFMMGSTTGGNFPTTPNAYDQTHNGSSDIFVCKFNSDGTQLLSSTFFGGSGIDGLNIAVALRKNSADAFRGDILLANNGDVVIASTTTSAGLATPGSFQTLFGGAQDGLLVRFNAALSQVRWCSYIGGNQQDALYGLKEGISGEVLAVGGSNSTNLTLPGFGFQTSNAGGADGIIVRLEALTGVGITGTFLGSPGYDQLFFVDIDELGTVYVTGHTDSNLITLNTNYNDPRSGQYIANFSNQLGTLNWLGRFGSRSGQPVLHLAAFVVDLCQNIYVSGYTGNMLGSATPAGPTNLQTTNNAMQATTDGFDFYLAAFSPGMLTLQYGTYFGGPSSQEHVDGGTSRFDKRGVMYQAICAGCRGNNDLPTTPNAYATTNGSINCNNAAIKLAFQLESGLGVNFGWTAPPTYCAPLTLQMEDYSRIVSNTSWFWRTSAGDSSELSNPQFTFIEPGNYSISLLIRSPDACNRFDTLTRTITVLGAPVLQLADTCICVEDSYQIMANVEGISYVWGGAGSGTERSIQPILSGIYTLDLVDANGCEASDSLNVEVITCFGKVPNVITPNGDGNNDRLTLLGNAFAEFELRAFNRWGQEVFSTTNQLLGWGGEHYLANQLVKPGDYYVRIKARFCTDRLIERTFAVKVLY